MEYEIKGRICDECGKKAQMRMGTQFVATPFKGWVRASLEGEDGLTSAFDFCSTECAGKHFTLFKTVAEKQIK